MGRLSRSLSRRTRKLLEGTDAAYKERESALVAFAMTRLTDEDLETIDAALDGYTEAEWEAGALLTEGEQQAFDRFTDVLEEVRREA